MSIAIFSVENSDDCGGAGGTAGKLFPNKSLIPVPEDFKFNVRLPVPEI